MQRYRHQARIRQEVGLGVDRAFNMDAITDWIKGCGAASSPEELRLTTDGRYATVIIPRVRGWSVPVLVD